MELDLDIKDFMMGNLLNLIVIVHVILLILVEHS